MKHLITVICKIFGTILLLTAICFAIGTSSIWVSYTIIGLAFIYVCSKLMSQICNYLHGRNQKVGQQERMLKLLITLIGTFFMTGSLLFLRAFDVMGEESHSLLRLYDQGVLVGEYLPDSTVVLFINAEYLMRSMTCSLDLFMLDIDSNVLDAIAMHPILKGAISLQAALSFSCTSLMLILLVFSRVNAYWRLHRLLHSRNGKTHLYIFFGINDKSQQLARSINECDVEQAIVIFVENSSVNKDEKGGWDSIVEFITNRKKTFRDAKDLDAYVTITDTCLYYLNNVKEGDDLLEALNIPSVKILIGNIEKSGGKVHIFFLSDDEEDNIRNVEVLANDRTISGLSTVKNVETRFYCHARRNAINRTIEDVAVKKGLDVRIVDSSYLSVELLKKDENNHPVRFVNIDCNNPTTVSDSFDCLILGFDEVGQDALGFLYEFGAFVDSRSNDNKTFRSPFHCIAVDKEIDTKAGVFCVEHTRLIRQRNADGTPLLRLKKCDFQSVEFYEKILQPNAEQLNYIVIAVGDDEKGITLAIKTFEFLRARRQNLENLVIMVRSYAKEKKSYLQKVINHYNQDSPVIRLFGIPDQLYSYDMIISEELVEKGRHFQEQYRLISRDSENWDDRRALLRGIKDKGETQLVTVPMEKRTISLDKLQSLHRKEGQDICNALHAKTKEYLLQKAMPNYNWKTFFDNYFEDNHIPRRTGNFDKINYSGLNPQENMVIRNLAKLEHLRWSASHEVLGYDETNEHKCDERTRRHNCLCSWENLDNESKKQQCDYKLYDYIVVDTTLRMFMTSPQWSNEHGNTKN